MLKVFILILSLFTSLQVLASPVDTYEFTNDEARQRYQTLVKELRCPKCQNQNLADSNSQIAVDLREKVYEMIEQGKSDEAIVDYMVARYGDFVLYRPQVSTLTYLLWYGPAILLLLGVLVVIFILRSKPVTPVDAKLSQAEQEKLNAFLKDK